MADFQARIFLRGKVTAQLPAMWDAVMRPLRPTFVDYLPATHSWKSTYLPVDAAMRAVFQSVALESFVNPVCAAISVLALAGAVRNIWPEQKWNPLIAAVLLASSSQFLITAMTSYSMPAHLALNAIWLWLYSRPDRRRFYLAPFVGVLAIGLHQPIVHALFVAPFLLRLVRQRHWRAVLIFGCIYLAGCAGWFVWRAHYFPPTGQGTANFFRLFNPSMIVIQPMDLSSLDWLELARRSTSRHAWAAANIERIYPAGCGLELLPHLRILFLSISTRAMGGATATFTALFPASFFWPSPGGNLLQGKLEPRGADNFL